MANPVAGGSGAGRDNLGANNDAAVQLQAAAQIAQQIWANTNVTLKQEVVKIPEFWGEKGKDSITATQFVARINECQISNKWNDTTTFTNFSLSL
jgi:hypothetical protein